MMLSALSSSLPLVFPRSSSLSRRTFSGQVRKRTIDDGRTCVPPSAPFAARHKPTHARIELDRLIHLPREPIDEE